MFPYRIKLKVERDLRLNRSFPSNMPYDLTGHFLTYSYSGVGSVPDIHDHSYTAPESIAEPDLDFGGVTGDVSSVLRLEQFDHLEPMVYNMVIDQLTDSVIQTIQTSIQYNYSNPLIAIVKSDARTDRTKPFWPRCTSSSQPLSSFILTYNGETWDYGPKYNYSLARYDNQPVVVGGDFYGGSLKLGTDVTTAANLIGLVDWFNTVIIKNDLRNESEKLISSNNNFPGYDVTDHLLSRWSETEVINFGKRQYTGSLKEFLITMPAQIEIMFHVRRSLFGTDRAITFPTIVGNMPNFISFPFINRGANFTHTFYYLYSGPENGTRVWNISLRLNEIPDSDHLFRIFPTLYLKSVNKGVRLMMTNGSYVIDTYDKDPQNPQPLIDGNLFTLSTPIGWRVAQGANSFSHEYIECKSYDQNGSLIQSNLITI